MVSAPDRPAGRGGHSSAVPVAARARELGLPLLQPERLRSPEALESIVALGAALGVLTDYGQIVPAALLEAFAAAGSDLVSVDWRVRLDDAWRRIGYAKGIQGNLDPVRPLAGWAAASAGMREILLQAAGRPGHIFNLGHGVMPDTDPDVLTRLVDGVHSETGR